LYQELAPEQTRKPFRRHDLVILLDWVLGRRLLTPPAHAPVCLFEHEGTAETITSGPPISFF
jgi:hypothetical protein